MKLPTRLTDVVFNLLLASVAARRPADFIIGADSPGGPYLLRWYITPWRGWYRHIPDAERTRWQRLAVFVSRLLPNLYLHKFLRDDDDRALHDHPSCAVSLILRGHYIEHTIANGGVHHRREYHAGSLRYLPTRHTHRIELATQTLPAYALAAGAADAVVPRPCWTLFLFGPVVRDWYFHCPERGMVPWQEFTAAGNPGEIGPGCGE